MLQAPGSRWPQQRDAAPTAREHRPLAVGCAGLPRRGRRSGRLSQELWAAGWRAPWATSACCYRQDIYYRAGQWAPFVRRPRCSPTTRSGHGCGASSPRSPARRSSLMPAPDAGLPAGAARGDRHRRSAPPGTAWAGACHWSPRPGSATRSPRRRRSTAAGWRSTDDPSSPHLAADRITATVYVAGAAGRRLVHCRAGRTAGKRAHSAGVDHTVEFYPARARIRRARQPDLRRSGERPALGSAPRPLPGPPLGSDDYQASAASR